MSGGAAMTARLLRAFGASPAAAEQAASYIKTWRALATIGAVYLAWAIVCVIFLIADAMGGAA